MSEKISVYGASGFIGGEFCRAYPNNIIKIPRNERKPQTKNIIYLIKKKKRVQLLWLDSTDDLAH